MKHEININNIDIIKTITFTQIQNKSIWLLCIIPALLINGVGFVGLWAIGFPNEETIIRIFYTFFWVFGLFLAGLILTILSLLLNPKWRKGRIGKHLIGISENGIVESTEYNRSEISWKAINKVSVKPSGIYIIYSGAEAIIIPSRCFSIEDWQNFKNLFLSKWQENKNT